MLGIALLLKGQPVIQGTHVLAQWALNKYQLTLPVLPFTEQKTEGWGVKVGSV